VFTQVSGSPAHQAGLVLHPTTAAPGPRSHAAPGVQICSAPGLLQAVTSSAQLPLLLLVEGRPSARLLLPSLSLQASPPCCLC
jgi:hypothetical protein